MTLIATIDAGACAAHGDCEAIAPEIFAIDDVAVVVVTGPDELMLRGRAGLPVGRDRRHRRRRTPALPLTHGGGGRRPAEGALDEASAAGLGEDLAVAVGQRAADVDLAG